MTEALVHSTKLDKSSNCLCCCSPAVYNQSESESINISLSIRTQSDTDIYQKDDQISKTRYQIISAIRSRSTRKSKTTVNHVTFKEQAQNLSDTKDKKWRFELKTSQTKSAPDKSILNLYRNLLETKVKII